MYLYCQKRERFFKILTIQSILEFQDPYRDSLDPDPDSGIYIWDMWALMNIFNGLMVGVPGLKRMPRRFARAKAKAEKARKARKKAKSKKEKRYT